VGRRLSPDALRIEGLAKRFGSTQALDDVDMTVAAGTVHALIGGNGSGKSTLIKILAGVVDADAGEVEVLGERHAATALTPTVAREAGLRFVHQQRSTFGGLTVAENLAVGRGFELAGGGRIRWRAQRRRSAEVLARFGVDARPDQLLGTLTPAKQTMVAIARALQDSDEARRGLLVLDEPTAALPLVEVEILLAALRRYCDAGQTIVYISHRLEEVGRLADRVTVLRDGRHVATVGRDGFGNGRLAELMLGRAPEQLRRSAAAQSGGEVRLEARGLRGGAVRDVDLVLRGGEVVGVAGLLGSGRTTLLRMLFGAVVGEAGTVRLDGEEVHITEPRDGRDAGVVYLPEDRPREAAFSELTVQENLSIACLGDYWHGGRLHHKADRGDARALLDTYAIRTSSEQAPLGSLSGGNQQKVILARWMRLDPRVLLLDEPTQGVDIGARAEIYKLVRDAVDRGATALVASSDFEELALLCDRILVLRRGRIADELAGGEMTETRLNHHVLGAEALA
jgi:ribose transport system ATP-binding protein